MRKRFTYRPSQLAKQKLTNAQKLLSTKGHKYPMNTIVDSAVINRVKNVRVSKKLKKYINRYSTNGYKKIALALEKISNKVNVLNNQIKGGYDNLNQLARKVNGGESNLDPNVLNQFRKLIKESKDNTEDIDKKVAKIWQKM